METGGMAGRTLEVVGREDWYRSPSWDAEIETRFFERLNRSRGDFHKAQYLRIQALYLREAGNVNVALRLLDILFEKHPDEFSVGSALHEKAKCLRDGGDIEAAVKCFKAAIAYQKEHSGPHDDSWLELSILVVARRLRSEYGFVRTLLMEEHVVLFPREHFRVSLVRALLAEADGDRIAAKMHARHALEWAGARHSGFSRHPSLGLVGPADASLVLEAQRLAH